MIESKYDVQKEKKELYNKKILKIYQKVKTGENDTLEKACIDVFGFKDILEKIISCDDDIIIKKIVEDIKKDENIDRVKEQILSFLKVMQTLDDHMENKSTDSLKKLLKELDKEENCHILENMDWYYPIIDGFEGDFDIINYDLVYSIFMKCISHKVELVNGQNFFFELLYFLDLEKMRKGLCKDIEDDFLLFFIRFKQSYFGVEKENLENFKEEIMKLIKSKK